MHGILSPGGFCEKASCCQLLISSANAEARCIAGRCVCQDPRQHYISGSPAGAISPEQQGLVSDSSADAWEGLDAGSQGGCFWQGTAPPSPPASPAAPPADPRSPPPAPQAPPATPPTPALVNESALAAPPIPPGPPSTLPSPPRPPANLSVLALAPPPPPPRNASAAVFTSVAVKGLAYPRATPLLSQAEAVNISVSFSGPQGAPAPVQGLAVGQVQIDSIPQGVPILLQVLPAGSEAAGLLLPGCKHACTRCMHDWPATDAGASSHSLIRCSAACFRPHRPGQGSRAPRRAG